MRTFLDRLYLFSGYLAGAFVVAIFVLMLLLSAGRPLGLNVPAGDEFIAWSMAATAFLGLAHTFRHGEMIRVGLLIDRFKGRARWWFDLLSLTLGLGFIAYFTFYAVTMTYDSYRFNDMANGVLAIPLWIPQLGFSGGLVILTIAFVDELFYVLTGRMTRFDKPPPATAEEAIERAVQSAV